MQLAVHYSEPNITFRTRRMLDRMVNPATGLMQLVGFLIHDSNEPRVLTAGAELTGVHVLRERPHPGIGFYHIGGGGIYLNEALIRCVGETAERYAQFISDVVARDRIRVASHDELTALGENVLDPAKLELFSEAQLAAPGFPYRRFDRQAQMGWLRCVSLVGGPPCWLPAQLVLVGYLGRPGEHRIASSVTTGSAAHTEPAAALRNSLRELIQIDAAMGHWYTSGIAPQIELDRRAAPMRALLERHWPRRRPNPRFHLLSSPDLPGFTIACVIPRPDGFPAAAVGLGIDHRLNHALYSAFVESVGVMQLAKRLAVDRVDSEDGDNELDPHRFFELDTNVLYYALPENAETIDARFSTHHTVPAHRLPEDKALDPAREARVMVDAFRKSGKALYWIDLTTPDIGDVGLVVSRAWSPDTLSLCLPSAPFTRHARYAAYGGYSGRLPHPYP